MKVGITMRMSFSLKSLLSPHLKLIFTSILFFVLCPILWASQDALIIKEKALIYADEEMTSPVGYVPRGKKIKIGVIPRNKSQVYPILVSGKVAWIKAKDVSTKKENIGDTTLVAERFEELANIKRRKVRYGLSYFNYSSQVSLERDNDSITDGDAIDWKGISLKGSGIINARWDVQIIANYMTTAVGREEFSAVEMGMGFAYRILDLGRLSARFEGQLMGVPFARYSVASKFTVNGVGVSTGAGLNLMMRLTERLHFEGSAGVYYTELRNFGVPPPFEEIQPSFFGGRLGVGLNYLF